MIVVTTEYITGKKLFTIGMVQGNTVQTKNFVKDFGAGIKNLVGGELKDYTAMLNEARGIATQRMIDQAQSLGADAIVSVRYSSSTITQGAAEILACGTAVKFIEE
jgi:uncharacterized protein YbjQ (UPF0145 family)